MLVKLQVVGLFYNVQVDVTAANPTVQSLMDAAVATPNPTGSINGAAAFSYGTHTDKPGALPTMSVMSASYKQPFTSRVLNNKYPAGVYSLKESFDPNTSAKQYSVWQYYMFDSSEMYVNPSSISESFTTQSLNGIARVTWRLVTILGAPTAQLNEMELMSKRDPRMRAAPTV